MGCFPEKLFHETNILIVNACLLPSFIFGSFREIYTTHYTVRIKVCRYQKYIYKKNTTYFFKLLVLQNNVHEIADGVVKINNTINDILLNN